MLIAQSISVWPTALSRSSTCLMLRQSALACALKDSSWRTPQSGARLGATRATRNQHQGTVWRDALATLRPSRMKMIRCASTNASLSACTQTTRPASAWHLMGVTLPSTTTQTRFLVCAFFSVPRAISQKIQPRPARPTASLGSLITFRGPAYPSVPRPRKPMETQTRTLASRCALTYSLPKMTRRSVS